MNIRVKYEHEVERLKDKRTLDLQQLSGYNKRNN